MHRHRFGQVGERHRRDIFELGGYHGAMAGQVIQRIGVIVVFGKVLAGEPAGGTIRVGIEHDHLVAHGPGRGHEHASKLSAA